MCLVFAHLQETCRKCSDFTRSFFMKSKIRAFRISAFDTQITNDPPTWNLGRIRRVNSFQRVVADFLFRWIGLSVYEIERSAFCNITHIYLCINNRTAPAQWAHLSTCFADKSLHQVLYLHKSISPRLFVLVILVRNTLHMCCLAVRFLPITLSAVVPRSGVNHQTTRKVPVDDDDSEVLPNGTCLGTDLYGFVSFRRRKRLEWAVGFHRHSHLLRFTMIIVF